MLEVEIDVNADDLDGYKSVDEGDANDSEDSDSDLQKTIRELKETDAQKCRTIFIPSIISIPFPSPFPAPSHHQHHHYHSQHHCRLH